MDFFSNNSRAFSFFEARTPNHGLRKGQVGALHALAAHFIERAGAAIVSLPTGYGKTSVIAGTCFLAVASRALLIVPTTALRTQMAKAFSSLETLRRLGALPAEDVVGNPVVRVIEQRMASEEDWAGLADADIIIAIPQSVSPEIDGIAPPPANFFDIVLFDEGHHSPARTWAAVIQATPSAKHVLFTATPFRKDRLQLPGKLVFYYSLRRAVDEHAFGRVLFTPVTLDRLAGRDERDTALIEKAVEIFQRDRDAGYQHRLLIRTDKVNDAQRLADSYTAAGLRIKAVSSRLSRTTVNEIERKLEAGELDGVVCVDMFGEGYDFPKFKIAVLHVPHRSLVPTLQFIGRFARTNDQSTGEATFIAVPTEVDSESEVLYSEGVDWDVLLADVADARQQLAIQEREALQAFQETAHPSADYEAVNPSHFRMPQHIAAYITDQAPDFAQSVDTLLSLQITNSWGNDQRNAYLLLAKEVKAPVWSKSESIFDSSHDCFLLKYFPETGIIFISATQRMERYYSELIKVFFGGNASSLSFDRARKVLNGLEAQEFFSVGLRNISPSATTETYRIVAGSNADRGVRDTDAIHFCQGHFFGRGKKGNESEIIGASSGGRIWSNGKVSIPELLDWMEELHRRISSAAVNIGPSGLDRLAYGEALTSIPTDTIIADWGKDCYRENLTIILGNGAAQVRSSLLDLSITNITVDITGRSMVFDVGNDVISSQFQYHLERQPPYSVVGVTTLLVESRDGRKPFEEVLNECPPIFYTSQLHSFTGTTLNRRHPSPSFDIRSAEAFDWTGCEIQVEFDYRNPDRTTVQRYLRDHLLMQPDLEFVIYDHRSGEAADFIVGQTLLQGKLGVTLYHCKGAGGERPSGDRLDDVYELACQAVKSVRFQRKELLMSHVERRTRVVPNAGHSIVLLGDRNGAIDAISRRQPIELEVSIVAVQPGLSCATLNENIKSIIAAANDSVASQQSRLTWLISA